MTGDLIAAGLTFSVGLIFMGVGGAIVLEHTSALSASMGFFLAIVGLAFVAGAAGVVRERWMK